MTRVHTLKPLVEVFWWDHYSIGDDWYEHNHKHQPCILSAVGYIVDENEYYYWLAATYEIATGSYSAGTAVLKNCVTQLNTLRPSTMVNWDGTPLKTSTNKRRPKGIK